MSSDDARPLPPIRAALDHVPVYKPGKPPMSRPGLQTYKLSSNENPYDPLPGVVEAVTHTLRTFNRYPDMGGGELYARIAVRLGVPVEHLAAGTGSVAVLYHLLQATCGEGDEVVYAWRSFEAYPIAVELTGARSVRVPLTGAAEHDLEAMAAAVTDRTRVVIVCTPNNPTGTAVDGAALRVFISQVPPDVIVVVDEAYREFVRDGEVADGVDLYRGRHNVVALRTFSKAYGLAGLRVGYAVAPERLADAIRKCALPFGVSSMAQVAAVTSLESEAALLERVEALVVERTRVVLALRDQGWAVPHSQANFVWLGMDGEGAAAAFGEACSDAGVMVRPFPGDGVRVTIGEPSANDVFLAVAATWLQR